MKLTVAQLRREFARLPDDTEVLVWWRTQREMKATDQEWSELEDDSQCLEDTITEYVEGWLEEVRDELLLTPV